MIDAREAVRRRPEYAAFRPLVEASDDAADELEEAVFLLGMLAAAKPDGQVLGPLRTLAGLLDEAAREWVKALGHAAHVREPDSADDTDNFLTAIDRIAALEHQTDDAERALTEAAVLRLAGIDATAIAHTRFAEPLPPPMARATVAGIGVASGPIALDAAAAARFASAGTPAILVRPETVTEDIAGLVHAVGLLTATGSRTAHAAVVARQLGKVCLVGCRELTPDLPRRTCRIGERMLAEGDPISLDGNQGAIYPGALPVVTLRPERELAIVAGWRAKAA